MKYKIIATVKQIEAENVGKEPNYAMFEELYKRIDISWAELHRETDEMAKKDELIKGETVNSKYLKSK